VGGEVIEMKKRNFGLIRIATLLTCFIMILNAAFSPAVAWTSDSQLTTWDAWDTGPCVLQDPEGKVWIVWASDLVGFQDDVYYMTSSDGGSSWSNLGLLTADPDEDSTPCAVVLSNGTMLFVWASDRTGNYDLFYKTSNDGGRHWSNAIQLTDDASRENKPSVIQDVDGNVWVFWQRVIGLGQFGIFYRIYNGTVWLDENAFISDSYSNVNPSATLTLNGSIWVVWSREIDGNYDIYYKVSNDGGANWLDRPPLVNDINWDIGPSVHMSKDGTIWVVWSTDRPNGGLLELYYKDSSDYGLNWTDDTLLVTSIGDDANPSITSDDEGRVWVAWESTRSGFDIYYKIFYHDVAVTGVWASVVYPGPHSFEEVRTWVYENNILYVDVNITNFGYEIERYFNVTVYYDSTIIGKKRVEEAVVPDETVTFSGAKYGFEWDTTGVEPGYYAISADSDIVSGEIDTSDNSLTETIRIRKAGDANGDDAIDILDAIQTAIAFEVYDVYSDFNTDGEINLYDALILMSAFEG